MYAVQVKQTDISYIFVAFLATKKPTNLNPVFMDGMLMKIPLSEVYLISMPVTLALSWYIAEFLLLEL